VNKTGIEWTEFSWNCLRGCSHVSEGCRNCYAERIAARFGWGDPPVAIMTSDGPRWNGPPRLIEPKLTEPLRRRKPSVIFVNSMSDTFHERVTDEWIDRMFAVMALCPQHKFLVLTKRARRMGQCIDLLSQNDGCLHNRISEAASDLMLPGDLRQLSWDLPGWPLPNLGLGVSVEDRKHKDRIDELRQTPAAMRFLSLEPLLEDLGELDLTGIHQVIVGGESGQGARPMHPDWARSVRDQCVSAGVPFFFKQHGEWAPKDNFTNFYDWDTGTAHGLLHPDGQFTIVAGRDKPDPEFGLTCADLDGNDGAAAMSRVGKKAAGRMLDGKVWDERPEGWR
jgi:protein gp37